jgi:hypothetical protein
MPFFARDHATALAVAREAEKFARHMRTIPVDKDAQPHPEMKDLLNGFRRINTYLSQRNAKGEVTLARKMRVGREFQRIGAALRTHR